MSDTETRQESPVWTLGERLHKAREFAGITRTGMADRLGVSERTIRNYENEAVRVTRSIVLAYAAETMVPVDWFSEDAAIRSRCVREAIRGAPEYMQPSLFAIAA
jgi:transcriptional regulator with XRE-family HTH domain